MQCKAEARLPLGLLHGLDLVARCQYLELLAEALDGEADDVVAAAVDLLHEAARTT
jgi:hypothetical protein